MPEVRTIRAHHHYSPWQMTVVQWNLEDVRDNCTSFQAFDHHQRFGMGEENTALYLCRGVTFDIQKIWL